MRAVKQFKEFIDKGTAKKQSQDRPRAEFLRNEAEKSYAYLNKLIKKMGIDDENANDYVKRCYDIIMALIRSMMLLKGYNAAGFGAHEAEVSYMMVLGFKENDVRFADQLRYFRNGILYYGSDLDKEYALKVIEFTKRIYERLMSLPFK